MQAAKKAISDSKACVKMALHTQRSRFVGHVGRFGLGDKPNHLCKAVFFWRPIAWWKHQQWYNDLGWNTIFHNKFQGGIRAFDRHLDPMWAGDLNDDGSQ